MRKFRFEYGINDDGLIGWKPLWTWCQEYGIGPRDYDPDCRARLSRIASGVQARVGGRVTGHVSERAACLCVEVKP